MFTPISILQRIEILSALSPMRGERAWVQDILEGWEDETENGYPRLTPFLGRRSTPVPEPERLLSRGGKYCGKSQGVT
jgi:hypothetical protein